MADQILALAKEARKTKLTCGIYRIDCEPNGKFYVGSSVQIPRRLSAHRSSLRGGGHPNPKLQAAWNKYGEAAFRFTVVIFCDEESLLAREQEAIDALDAVGRGFNLSFSATAPMLGRTHTDEAKEKIREAVAGRVISDETRRRIKKSAQARGETTSEQMREMWKTRGQDVIDKIAASNTGQKRDEVACANIGAATKRKWESAEFREKMSLAWDRRREAGPTDEARDNFSAAMRKKWQDPELREKFIAVHKGRKNTEETKAKMRASALAREARKREASAVQ